MLDWSVLVIDKHEEVPLSVDGMIVASSMLLLLDSRLGYRGGVLPWVLLIIGALASLGANIAVAEPTLIGRVTAAWPSFALTASYELLMRQVRQTGAIRTTMLKTDGQKAKSRAHLGPSATAAATSFAGNGGRPRPANGARALQRQACQWALANRDPDGSLPGGAEVAQAFERSPRWGRLVKNAGLAGELG